MKLKKNNIVNWLGFFLCVFIFATVYPLVLNHILFREKKATLTFIAFAIWVFLFIALRIKGVKKIIYPAKSFSIIILIQIIYFLIWGSILDSDYIVQMAASLVYSWGIIFLLLNTVEIKFFTYNFIKLHILFLILMLIGFVLLSFGLLHLYDSFTYYNTEIYNYGFFIVKGGEESMRPSSYYDEAGSLAFVVMFLLLLNRKKFGNSRWEFFLLLIPLISTSLAHIITVVIFILLFYFSTKNKMKLFFVLFFVVILFSFLDRYSEKNEGIKAIADRTIGRIDNIITNKEDNGSREGAIKWGPVIWEAHPWGISFEEVRSKYPDFVSDSFWGPILYFNILGMFFFSLPFLYILKKIIQQKDIESAKYFILIFANLLQRPVFQQVMFMLLIYILFWDTSFSSETSKATSNPKKTRPILK